jgi:hypothetical protein
MKKYPVTVTLSLSLLVKIKQLTIQNDTSSYLKLPIEQCITNMGDQRYQKVIDLCDPIKLLLQVRHT